MSPLPPKAQRVLVTGAAGFLGQGLVRALCANNALQVLVAVDVRPLPADIEHPGLIRVLQDVRDPALVDTLRMQRIDTVVHLASIVTPGKGSSRAFEHSVDVGGSRNVLQACLQTGVRHLLVSSSGAAYGYHADNPPWLAESHPLRGNESFAYSHHKRLVEEMLADFRRTHPHLLQTVLRIGTILGEQVDNQITALFEKNRLLAIRGSESPFVFIWNEDVSGAILHALSGQAPAGCYNLAGDGALTIGQIAQALNKPLVSLPAALLHSALWVGSRLGISRYGPQQMDFLRYRPVLLNTALKTVFGYHPRMSSSDAFEAFVEARDISDRPVRRLR